MQKFLLKLLAKDEKDRYLIKDIFNDPLYSMLTQGNKLQDSIMYQEKEKEEKDIKPLYNHLVDPRVSKISYSKFLKPNQKTTDIAKETTKEIINCHLAAYAAHEVLCLFQEYNTINQYKWMAIYSLVRSAYYKGGIIFEMVYKKKQNIYGYD